MGCTVISTREHYLDSTTVKKGAAVPAVEGAPRQEPIALTLKVPPELYLKLKSYAMRTQPRKTSQQALLEALQAHLQAEGAL